jgi:hypothetical protein
MVAVREKMDADTKEHGIVYAMEQLDMSIIYRTFMSGLPALWCKALQLCASPENHPLVFHCSAGRDRTGVLAMLILHMCGATREEILADYVLSKCLAPSEGLYDTPFGFSDAQSAYFEAQGFPVDDKRVNATEVMLGQIDPADMATTMAWLASEYGSIEGYLDAIGFDSKQRERLKQVLAAEVVQPASTDPTGIPSLPPMTQRYFEDIGFRTKPAVDCTIGVALGRERRTEKGGGAKTTRQRGIAQRDLPAFAREWTTLTAKEKRACRTLGWDQQMWEASDDAPLGASWVSLSGRQQVAAVLLGFGEEDFDGADAKL